MLVPDVLCLRCWKIRQFWKNQTSLCHQPSMLTLHGLTCGCSRKAMVLYGASGAKMAHCHIYHVESPWLPGSAKENYKHLRIQETNLKYHVWFVKLTAKHLKIGQPYPKRKACLPTIHFQLWFVSFRGGYLWKTMQNSRYSKKWFVRTWHRCMIIYIYPQHSLKIT